MFHPKAQLMYNLFYLWRRYLIVDNVLLKGETTRTEHSHRVLSQTFSSAQKIKARTSPNKSSHFAKT